METGSYGLHAASILSGLAYLALCLLAAGSRLGTTRPCSAARPEGQGRGVLACLIVLPAWWGIPPGTLPAFVPAGWSGAAALACLAVSCGHAAGWRLRPASLLRIPSRLGLALAACAWYARQRGVPGDLLSLDTYVAMPLAGVTEGPAATAGLALLGLGALPLCEMGGDGAEDRAASLRHLAGLAVWICLFLPACPARDLGLEGLASFALDGLYFWGKILVLDYVLRLATAGTAPGAAPGAASCARFGLPAVQAGCAVAGTLLLCW